MQKRGIVLAFEPIEFESDHGTFNRAPFLDMHAHPSNCRVWKQLLLLPKYYEIWSLDSYGIISHPALLEVYKHLCRPSFSKLPELRALLLTNSAGNLKA